MSTTGKATAMPIDPRLRRRIRVLLAEQDIDQKELARRTGLSTSTICNLLNGHTNDARLSTIESIARALGCVSKILLEYPLEDQSPS